MNQDLNAHSIVYLFKVYLYWTQVYLGHDLWVRVFLTNSLYICANLTDVTLADENANSILNDNANWAIQGNVTLQVLPPDCQL